MGMVLLHTYVAQGNIMIIFLSQFSRIGYNLLLENADDNTKTFTDC